MELSDEQVRYKTLAELIASRVRVNQAAQVGTRAVDFVRGKDVVSWMHDHPEDLKSAGVASNDPLDLGSKLVALGLLRRADRADVHNVRKDDNSTEVRKPGKWPRRLEVSAEQVFDGKGFYVLTFEGNQRSHHVVLGLVIAVILFFCMFPAWPLKMKMGGWYISVLLMTGILILIVVRLALFVACWFGGADFWLYPNLFADDLGPIDSFRPLYTFRYRNDDWIMVAARIFSVLLSVAAVFKLGETHSFRDIGQFGRQQFLDVVDWGYQKLSNESDELITPEGLKIEPINEFLDENGLDFSCMRKCRFSSWIEVREECLFDCDCAVELVNGPCFKKCTKEVQTKIEEIHRYVLNGDSVR